MRSLGWVRVGFLGGVVALIVPACGDDERQIEGASNGGTSNSNGSGGSGNAGSGGGGTGGGAPGNSFLGIECERDADCPTGLICLSSSSDSLTQGGPARGMCTFACGGGDQSLEEADAECQQFDPNSLCQFFREDAAYCVQRCTLGDQGSKCQGREDLVCDLVLHLPEVRTTCESDSDCDINDFCLSETGECFSSPAVCLPRCAVDTDCPVGRFCDPRWGECVDEEPTGRRFGESCNPNATVNECAGICTSEGQCTEKCVLGAYPACGSSNEARATAGCVFGYYQGGTAAGDVGACGRLCDCNADCLGETSCVQLVDANGVAFDWRGRPGVCTEPGQGATVLSDCDSGTGGSGGTGGSDAGGAAGRAGAAGQGGSP